jgi:hypothetical protein
VVKRRYSPNKNALIRSTKKAQEHRMTMVLSEGNFNPTEVTIPENTSVPTTSDVIKVSEDIQGEVNEEKSYETIINEGTQCELRALDSWLSWRVKNELVPQILKNIGIEEWQINIQAVHTIIKAHISTEKVKHFQDAAYIKNELIPLASTRPTPLFGDPNYFWRKDILNLQARTDIHTLVSSRMSDIEATGDDGMYDLSEKYIQLMIPAARDEVLAILTEQKRELLGQNQRDIARIDELEATIVILGLQLEQSVKELQVRDMELLDGELSPATPTHILMFAA